MTFADEAGRWPTPTPRFSAPPLEKEGSAWANTVVRGGGDPDRRFGKFLPHTSGRASAPTLLQQQSVETSFPPPARFVEGGLLSHHFFERALHRKPSQLTA